MFNFDRRTLYIILGVMVLMNVLLGGRSIEGIIYALPGVIVAMTFHEFAHAWMATKLGDDTPRLQGRLNLNPMSHIDPVGIVCLALLGFGWGRPVQINPRNFSGKYSLSKAEAMVAAAGPIMNFIVAFIFLIILVVVKEVVLISNTTIIILKKIISSIIMVNLGLGIFNLIPIHPLDGSKVLNNFLPYRAREWMMNNQFILTIIVFFIVFYTNLMDYIIIYVANGMEWIVKSIIGLFI